MISVFKFVFICTFGEQRDTKDIHSVVKVELAPLKINKSLKNILKRNLMSSKNLTNFISSEMLFTWKIIYSCGHSLTYGYWVSPLKIRWLWESKNLPLKCCQPFEILIHLEEGFRSFLGSNIWSVGQRATKLPSIKLWEWFVVQLRPNACNRASFWGI